MLDIAKELEKTLHIHSDELPYIPSSPGLESRILHARPEADFFVTQLRAAPNSFSGLHKHPVGRGGFTLKGHWGHDHHYLYRPGTYIYEMPGVIHQFFNGPEETEVVFFGPLAAEMVDPETLQVVKSVTGASMLQKYLDHCEERGAKPHFLS